jgi:uncharacterized protein (TIGR03000 family)
MVRQWFFRAGLPAVALAALLWAGGPVLAQRGGHGGGGHGGGGHGGGGHVAAASHGWSGSHGSYGNWYGGRGYYGNWYGGRGYYGNYYHNRGYWPYYLYGLGYWPYLGYGYGYGNGYYPSYDSGYYGYNYGPDYSYAPYSGYYAPESYAQPLADYSQSFGGATNNRAHITVTVPSRDAEVWFENYATNEIGTVRQFASPALTPGKQYVYHVRAHWTQNGREFQRAKDVNVSAGSSVAVDFTQAANLDAMPRAID